MNIPDTYVTNEILSSAYRNGWNHGNGIACHNVPTLGAKIFSDSLGRVTVDAENIREVHESECWAAQENARQYSPFEFLAHDMNSLDDETDEEKENEISSEQAWEAFEQGITDSIFADLATYSDEDYGILKNENDEDGE